MQPPRNRPRIELGLTTLVHRAVSDSVNARKLGTKSWSCLALAAWGCLGGAGCTDGSAGSDHPWVAPSVETAPVPSRGDAADDPAIWIHPDAPERSLIVATDKRSGIFVYDLAGRERQYVPAGNLNNVDLRTGAWGQQELTIAVASGRQPAELVVFELDHSSGQLRVVRRNEPVVDEPYGICLYLDDGDQPWVVLNGKDGLFVQFELRPDYSVRETRRWRTQTQPEGCVVDDAAGVLYVGEENHGVWTLPADPRQPAELVSFAKVADGILSADVEGMALYRVPGEARTELVVSSQGDSSFAVYDVASGAHRVSFRVGGHDTIDAVSDTDGIASTSTPLPGFPNGMLVVQDGDNPGGNQNFKFVSWTEIGRILKE